MNNKVNILFVEDDENLGFVTQDNLERSGYNIHWEKDGASGFDAFCSESFDLCIFDIMLPQKDGFTLASEVRAINEQIPILFLTAKALDQDKIEGFKIGGDDYVTKPFNMELLHLRIEALLKRSENQINLQGKIFDFGNSMLDCDLQVVKIKGQEEKLSQKEVELLKLLVIHRNKVLSREIALKLIWGENDYFKGRSMDVFIARLRKLIKLDSALEIVTIHGKGFQLNDSTAVATQE